MAEVRPATPRDAPAIAAVYAPYVTDSAASFEVEPPAAADVVERMATGLPWYVAESAGQVVGFAYGSPHRARAHAGITLPNAASVGLHERCGFVHVGTYADVGFKQGRWHDVGWWSLALQVAPDVPAEPRAWDGRR